MKRVIATLPLSPRQHPLPGYCLSAFAVHIFGALTGLTPLIALNTKGMKGWTMQDADAFTDLLSGILETPFDVWHDEQQTWTEILLEFSRVGLQEGWLSVEERETYCCDCGKVEFLPEPLNLIESDFRRKAYKIQGGRVTCRLCHSDAVRKQTTGLFLQLPKGFEQVDCYPNYARLEWDGLCHQLCDRKLLISRTRDTGMQIQIGSSIFFLDVDLCWMLMPFMIAKKGLSVDTLVCGHKTIKHALLTMAVSKRMNMPPPSTIITVPYLHVRHATSMDVPAEKLLEIYKPGAMRMFLAMALGNSAKEIILSENDFRFAEYTTQRSISMFPLNEYFSMKDAWNAFGIQKIRFAAAQIRRGHRDRLPLEMKQIFTLLLRHSP